MRVLHVIEAMHQGGAESLVVEHVRHAAAGVTSVVVALNRGGPALEAARAGGARALVLDKGARRGEGVRRLARMIAEERIDVVNGHNPSGALYGTLAGTAARVPAILRTEHSVHYPGRHSRLYAVLLEPLATLRTRFVVCVCEASRRSHARRQPWLAGRFVTVLNGVSEAAPPAPRAATRSALGLAEGETAVLAVGSLTRQKAHPLLVDAFARVRERLPHARLLIAGEGERRAALEERIGALGLGAAVRLLGARGDVADLIEACDLFVLSSEREGLSVTLLEAMRGARAAVVTDVGGNAEAVVHGETGLVVPGGDPAALAAALLELAADPARRAALGAAARARWAARFTAARMVAETERLYRAALGARAEPEGRHAAA